ncbi:MAG: zinc-dependent alcohol dehydrogenase family protein [Gammaproteobacteria bacterium]|nr:zinc-dependent alcohol dehydrogenase family protein [Gammaproteobacteria bacterium]
MKTRMVRLHELGGPEVLRIESLDVPAPGAGEVLVRMEAIGLNRAEAAFRQGHYFEPPQLPARIGYEGAGRVAALGPDVPGFAHGDAVCIVPGFSMNRYGVYAEQAIVPASALLPRPPGMSATDGAAIWMPLLTAYGALVDITGLRSGDAVLITAASSSVGLAAIEIANAVGATPIAVTRGTSKLPALRQAGAAHVISSDTQDIATETARITGGRGARLAFDPIGGPIVAVLASALGVGGSLIVYGNLSGQARNTVFPFATSALKGITMRAYLVLEIINDIGRYTRARQFVLAGLEAGRFRPHIDRTFPFDAIVSAHRYLESNAQVGKIVVTVGS